MFHRMTLIGFVEQDPQMRYCEDGTPVTNFSVATCQVVSKERVAGCPTGWKESLNGKNWELAAGHAQPARDRPGQDPAGHLS